MPQLHKHFNVASNAMTHATNAFIYLMFLFQSLTSCGQRHLDIHTNSSNRGDYCYVLWTSDTTLSNPKSGNRLTFDKNNVVYVHKNLQVCKNRIRIISEEGKDISDNMINVMSDVGNTYLNFYNATDDEIKMHPHWDQYYKEKFFAPNNGLHKLTRSDLLKLGYQVANGK